MSECIRGELSKKREVKREKTKAGIKENRYAGKQTY